MLDPREKCFLAAAHSVKGVPSLSWCTVDCVHSATAAERYAVCKCNLDTLTLASSYSLILYGMQGSHTVGC